MIISVKVHVYLLILYFCNEVIVQTDDKYLHSVLNKIQINLFFYSQSSLHAPRQVFSLV